MAKEVLKISLSKVVVDYDFRNDSDEDVTTEVAFPIPAYENGPDQRTPEESSFSDFHLTVDGRPVTSQADVKAFLKKRDVTEILRADRIDIATFGHWDWKNNRNPEFSRLSKPEQTRLVKLGLFDADEPWGNWSVHLQYHWTQRFAARTIVHIRHEYSPVVGFTQFSQAAVDNAMKGGTNAGIPEELADLRTLCMDRQFLEALSKGTRESLAQAKTDEERLFAGVLYPSWVDFILTSANTWKQPIEDFTMIVERPKPKTGDKTLVSFCAPEHADVLKMDADHFQVHLTNLIPKAELHIGLFEVPENKPAKSLPSK